MKKNIILFTLFLFLVVWIFKSWFELGVISAGDLRYFYESAFKDYPLVPYAWNWELRNGLGGFESPFAWLSFNLNLPLFWGSLFRFNWSDIERIFYLFPFLILCILSIIALFKKVFPRDQYYLLAALIYLFNTYILMMVGGGQIVGISLAYAVFPLVMWQFISYSENHKKVSLIYKAINSGLLFALLIFFDLRFAYIFVFTIILFYLFTVRKNWGNVILLFVIALSIAGFIHAFWIVPVLLSHQNPVQALGSAYTSFQSVKYFSFAKLEDSISLLHPNWPENIFGKVYFMRPEFLFIPIIVYTSLLFFKSKDKNIKSKIQLNNQKFNSNEKIEQSNNQLILFFAFLGLLGAFLAKGANDPFGVVYLWMFNYIPGFDLFRDPSKFYILVALSYSILIPLTIHSCIEWFNSRFKFQKAKLLFNIQNYVTHLLIIFFICFWLFTLRQAVFWQLNGTFKPVTIPANYLTLENYLSNQHQFSRSLWVPTTQRYAFSTTNHPSVSAQDFFSLYDNNKLIQSVAKSEKQLQVAGIKYVIVPTDPQGEIFLKDRSYYNKAYLSAVSRIKKISWLKPLPQVSNLALFEVPGSKSHFWSPDAKMKISYSSVSPVEYNVSVTNAKEGDFLVFSESYDPQWFLISSTYSIVSSKYDNLFNGFMLPENGNYSVEVYYTSQKWVDVGSWISAVTILLVLVGLVLLKIISEKNKMK